MPIKKGSPKNTPSSNFSIPSTSEYTTTHPPPRNRQNTQPPQSPRQQTHNNDRPPPSPRTNNLPFDEDGIGHNLRDSLNCLGLTFSATERDAKVRFWKLSRIYHSDKHDSSKTGLTEEEAKAKFQLLNNAFAFVRDRL